MEIKAIDAKDRMVFKRHIQVDNWDGDDKTYGGGGGGVVVGFQEGDSLLVLLSKGGGKGINK
jgi:hypothetical protein